MKKPNFAKVGRALKGKSFLIALVICFAAVGISTYLAYSTAISKIGSPDGLTAETEDETFIFPEEDEEVDKVQEGVPLETEAEDEEANSFFEAALPSAAVVMPVSGEIINPFSAGELVKSETLGVWKTHDGIDIAAEDGTDVETMTSGTVTEVYTDPLWGICVTIDHGDGLTGCYMSMDPNVSVKVGDKLIGGEIIGKTGSSAEIEIAQKPHLHFALKKNGEWIDPAAYISNTAQ